MAGLTITPAQRVALARRLKMDPHDLDTDGLLRVAGELADRAGRSYAEDSDPTGILKLDRTVPMTTPVTATTYEQDGDESERLYQMLAEATNAPDSP
ncbi:MAG: hypothetical protein M3364_03505 [Actinomycetota bacterium]|nr:hypothetical protein [Actinomycetota bacterium]